MSNGPKVRRLYHFLKVEHALSNLKNKRIKVARFHEMNDPLELAGSKLETPNEIEKFMRFKDEVDSKWGIICFSGKFQNQVMWAHYGDKYKGVCLGFDLSPSIIYSVDYKSERSKTKKLFNLNPESKMDIQNASKVKSDLWYYEKESRVLVAIEDCNNCGDIYFYPFQESIQLKTVILGPYCKLTGNEISNAICEYTENIECYKTRFGFKSYRVFLETRMNLFENDTVSQ